MQFFLNSKYVVNVISLKYIHMTYAHGHGLFTVFPPESAVSTSFRPSRGTTPREVAPHHLAARTSRDRAARDSCGSTRSLLSNVQEETWFLLSMAISERV